MSQEAIRICGFRKVGGTYLMGTLFTKSCDRLPLPIYHCPTCGSGIKFSRGVQSLNFYKYAGNHLTEGIAPCLDDLLCYVCHPGQFPQPYYLIWVGQEYTPASFISEARKLGISKRVPAKPRNVKPGTIVLLAHNDAANGIISINPWDLEADENEPEDTNKPKNHPGIFAAFTVTAIEKLIWESEADEDTLKKMEGQGITPVVIKDGDSDHDPEVSNDFTPEERAYKELGELKKKLLAH